MVQYGASFSSVIARHLLLRCTSLALTQQYTHRTKRIRRSRCCKQKLAKPRLAEMQRCARGAAHRGRRWKSRTLHVHGPRSFLLDQYSTTWSIPGPDRATVGTGQWALFVCSFMLLRCMPQYTIALAVRVLRTVIRVVQPRWATAITTRTVAQGPLSHGVAYLSFSRSQR